MLGNLVWETATCSGSGGTYTLGGAKVGYRGFVAAIGNTNAAMYFARYADQVANGSAAEWGIATVTDGSPDTLVRSTLLGSTTGSAISWTAGQTIEIYCSPPKERALWLGAAPAANKGLYLTSSAGEVAQFDLTTAGRAILDDADATAQRATLGLVIGTDVQAYDADLAAIAALVSAADRMPYATGAGAWALATLTAAGRALIDDADAAAQRTTLGLGTAATQNTGTSGANVPLLNGNNVFSGTLTASSTVYLGGASGAESLQVVAVASAVNRLEARGSVTTAAVLSSAAGSDTNVSIVDHTKGSGTLSAATGSSTNIQAQIAHTASAVNYLRVTGAATANLPVLVVAGSDTNIGLSVGTKGTQSLLLATGGGTQVQINDVASAVDYMTIQGASAGNAPGFQVGGASSNVQLRLRAKGTGTVSLRSGSGEQVLILDVASPVNAIGLAGGAVGSGVTVSAQGADSNIPLILAPKGTSYLQVSSDVLRITTSKTPATSSATGTAGSWCWDANYMYVCTATDTWKRAALSSW